MEGLALQEARPPPTAWLPRCWSSSLTGFDILHIGTLVKAVLLFTRGVVFAG